MIVHEGKKSSTHKKREPLLRYGLRCPLLALSGHPLLHRTCPLSGVKQTVRESAFAVAIGGKADMGWCTAYVRL